MIHFYFAIVLFSIVPETHLIFDNQLFNIEDTKYEEPARDNLGSYIYVFDDRNHREYKAKRINNKIWMTENLDYSFFNLKNWCYNNCCKDCEKYGRLYDWHTAQEVCPDGWRLPDLSDIKEIMNYTNLDGSIENESNNIKTIECFNQTYAGWRAHSGGYFGKECVHCCWLADSDETFHAYSISINKNNPKITIVKTHKSSGMSVRCVKDITINSIK